MKSDVNGCSTCPVGAEQWEEFERSRSFGGGKQVQYDYRHTNGRFFPTIAPDLETARARRDAWVANGCAGARDFTREAAGPR